MGETFRKNKGNNKIAAFTHIFKSILISDQSDPDS